MKVIATYNSKGGVGKTTAAVNLAYLAAQDGARTLLWDLDPQGAASFFFRIKPRVKGGAKSLLGRRKAIDRAIKGTDFDNLDLVPADFSFRNMDLHLAAAKQRTSRFDRRLQPLAPRYDYVFIDCPPTISLVSENVFRAADALLVPLVPTTLALRSLEQLERFLGKTAGESAAGDDTAHLFIFLSMVDHRKKLHRELVAALTAERPDLLSIAIPASSDIERMGLHRAPLPAFAPRSRSAAAFRDLWREVAARI